MQKYSHIAIDIHGKEDVVTLDQASRSGMAFAIHLTKKTRLKGSTKYLLI